MTETWDVSHVRRVLADRAPDIEITTFDESTATSQLAAEQIGCQLGQIAKSIVFLVDDRPENCLDVAIDSSSRAILVWRGEEGKVPGSARQLGIGSVSSIAECLDILETLDRSEGSGVGMIERLKRLLGLKPQAARSKGPIRPAQADVPSRVSGIG